MDRNEKIEAMQLEIKRLECVQDILTNLEQSRDWERVYHRPDDEHEDPWYTIPTEEDYSYMKYTMYTEVIAMVEKHYFK